MPGCSHSVCVAVAVTFTVAVLLTPDSFRVVVKAVMFVGDTAVVTLPLFPRSHTLAGALGGELLTIDQLKLLNVDTVLLVASGMVENGSFEHNSMFKLLNDLMMGV